MTLPKAARLTTAAAMANALSTGLRATTTDPRLAMGAGAAAAAVGRETVGADVAARAAVGGAGGAFAGAAAVAVGGTDTIGAAVAPTGAAEELGGSVGSLIVGEAVGLGGRLMRTVSFLGWTLAASAGLGGRAPPGKFVFSDISVSLVEPS